MFGNNWRWWPEIYKVKNYKIKDMEEHFEVLFEDERQVNTAMQAWVELKKELKLTIFWTDRCLVSIWSK